MKLAFYLLIGTVAYLPFLLDAAKKAAVMPIVHHLVAKKKVGVAFFKQIKGITTTADPYGARYAFLKKVFRSRKKE